MFYKALLISILIHLLLLCWPCSSRPWLTERTKTGFPPDQQVEYRMITLVELPPPPVGSNEELFADSQGNSTGNLSEKTAKQTVSLDRLSHADQVALPSPPVPVPAKQPSLSTEPEPAGKPLVFSPPVQPVEQGLTSSSQDRMMDGPFPPVAAVEAEAAAEEGEEAGQTEKLRGFNGDLRRGETGTLPAGFENGSAPSLVKVFHTDPVYPRLARRRGWEGTVYLTARIAPDGKVIATEVTQSSGYERLDQAAQEAVGQWRYAWSDGETETAVEQTITVKIRFQLED
ncbi:MAG: TonB family protein [Firmicutes bacterium]|nr:TonB family protein [Bacillota bacterium]